MIFPPTFKISFRTIVLLLPRPAHYSRYNFANKMAGQEPVGSIYRPSDSSSRDSEGPEFIQYLDGREHQIHEFWTFSEDGVTREVHLEAQVDVSAEFVGELSTNHLT